MTELFGPLLTLATNRKSSDVTQRILLRAGFIFKLSDNEQYSSVGRMRAYERQAQEQFAAFSAQRQSSTVMALCSYFWKDGADSREKLMETLEPLRWHFDGSNILGASKEAQSAFFEKGQTHDAYVFIREVLQQANEELLIIDPYSGSSTLQMLATVPTLLRVRILKGSRAPSDLAIETERFATQYKSISIELRNSDNFHDRFAILDSNMVYFFGASIQHAANKAFAIFAVESRPLAEMIMRYAEEVWSTASIVYPPPNLGARR